MKSLTVLIGTRPEAIKMAPLISELLLPKYGFRVRVVATGQHQQMLDQALELFGIVPDVNLDVMNPGQDLSSLTASILVRVRDELVAHPSDAVLVHGDTTTALAGSLASFFLGIPVGHVESGLRTYNVHSPFPEELNRQVVGRVAKWHFAPTDLAKSNLLAEGVPSTSIWVTGNTVIDALHLALKRISTKPQFAEQLYANVTKKLAFDWRTQRFVLITGHRRENFGGGFGEISKALSDLARRSPTTHFVYPVHLNPRVREQLDQELLRAPNIHLIEPLQYAEFVSLLEACYLVLTDSGGIQEEAPSLGKPVLVMRETTERPEAVEVGTARLVGADAKNILAATVELLEDSGAYNAMAQVKNPFGDGRASARIAEALLAQ